MFEMEADRDARLAWDAEDGQLGEANQSGSRAATPRLAEHDELSSTHVWHTDHNTDNSQPLLLQLPTTNSNTPNTRRTSSPLHPDIFQPPPPSPTASPTIAVTVPSDEEEAAISDPDSDFELVDSDTRTQIDGAAAERRTRSYISIPTALRERYQASRKAKSSSPEHSDDEDWDAVPAMEGGNEYEQPEWSQAGPHADAQDLAGPGEHGTLECTVTKPQKEGEGTQNVYVSYLVTTEVSTPRLSCLNCR